MASPTVVSNLTSCENIIINKFNDMYAMTRSHKKNNKVSKNDLIDLFDYKLSLIINKIELIKVNDNNANVESAVNDLLKDVITKSDINLNTVSNDNMNNGLSNSVTEEEVLINGQNTSALEKTVEERLNIIEMALNLNVENTILRPNDN